MMNDYAYKTECWHKWCFESGSFAVELAFSRFDDTSKKYVQFYHVKELLSVTYDNMQHELNDWFTLQLQLAEDAELENIHL